MKKQFFVALMVLMMMVGLAGFAMATPQLITDSNDPSLNNSSLIDFNAEANGNFNSRSFGAGAVTFSVATGDLYIEGTHAGLYGATGNYLANRTNGADIKISFTNAVSAFGFSWGAAEQPWTMSLYNSSNTLLGALSIAAQTSPYVGFIGGTDSLNSISYVVMSDLSSYGYDYFILDNLEYVTANNNQVPEPATLLLLGLGVMGLAGARKKIKK